MVMKVTDAMVEAACVEFLYGWGDVSDDYRQAQRIRMRATLEAALAAWVKPTRAESARARWDAMTPEQRRQHTAPALKGRLQSQNSNR